MPNVAPSIINVRFAGERYCSTDLYGNSTKSLGTPSGIRGGPVWRARTEGA
jgi:hypothetical protein